MKCSYNNFADCIVEKCPSCNYDVIESKEISGRISNFRNIDQDIAAGYAWYETKKKYVFKSCRLVDGNVQPVPSDKVYVNVQNKNTTYIRNSIF